MNKMTAATLARYNKKMVQEYKRALTSIRAELAKLMEKLGKGTIKDWQRYRAARDVELYGNIIKELEALGTKTAGLVEDLKKVTYKQGYYNGIWEIDQQTKFLFTASNPQFASLPTAAINGLAVKTDWLQFEVAMKNITELNKANIKGIVNQGLIQGKGIGEISAEIHEELGQKAARAVTIARTETQRAVNKGALDSYQYAQENGVKLRKKWLHGTVGSRSQKAYEPRPEHEELNGQYAETEGPDGDLYFELTSGENKGSLASAPGQFEIAGQDINCTCSMAAEVDDYKPPVEPAGVKADYSNFNEWIGDKIGEDLN